MKQKKHMTNNYLKQLIYGQENIINNILKGVAYEKRKEK